MKKLNNLTHILVFLSLSSFLFLNSCGTEEELGDQTLTISLSSTSVTVGSTITFNATSSIEGDVSSEAIFFVNDTQISGNTFSPSEASMSNEVYATFNGLTSNTVVFTSTEEAASSYTQKVLVEDYTGTWCGYCPSMAGILDIYTNYSENVIPVAIHCDGNQFDPWVYELHDPLVVAYGAQTQPTGKINRIHTVNQFPIPDRCPDNSNPGKYTEQLDTYLNQNAPLGLAINSTLNGSSLSINVKVGFATDNVPQARLIVYLIEEGLRYDQVNYFANTAFPDCIYNTGDYNHNPIPNFTQKHVLLKTYTDIFGDVIPQDQIANGAVYSRDFSVSLPSHVTNPDNLRIVAFVLGNGNADNNRAAINAQVADVGTNQDFD